MLLHIPHLIDMGAPQTTGMDTQPLFIA